MKPMMSLSPTEQESIEFFLPLILYIAEEKNEKYLNNFCENIWKYSEKQSRENVFDHYEKVVGPFLNSYSYNKHKEKFKLFLQSLFLKLEQELDGATKGVLATSVAKPIKEILRMPLTLLDGRKKPVDNNLSEDLNNLIEIYIACLHRFVSYLLERMDVAVDTQQVERGLKATLRKKVLPGAMQYNERNIANDFKARPLMQPEVFDEIPLENRTSENVGMERPASVFETAFAKWRQLHWGWKVAAVGGCILGSGFIIAGAIFVPPTLLVLPFVPFALPLSFVFIGGGSVVVATTVTGHAAHVAVQQTPVRERVSLPSSEDVSLPVHEKKREPSKFQAALGQLLKMDKTRDLEHKVKSSERYQSALLQKQQQLKQSSSVDDVSLSMAQNRFSLWQQEPVEGSISSVQQRYQEALKL